MSFNYRPPAKRICATALRLEQPCMGRKEFGIIGLFGVTNGRTGKSILMGLYGEEWSKAVQQAGESEESA